MELNIKSTPTILASDTTHPNVIKSVNTIIVNQAKIYKKCKINDHAEKVQILLKVETHRLLGTPEL